MQRLFVLVFAFIFSLSYAQLCQTWQASTLGSLDGNTVGEASGLSSSHLDSERLYTVSDSDSPHFYLSGLDGDPLQRVRIGTLGDYARDLEDIDVGPCGRGSCLFWGNIGGNNMTRNAVEVILIEELATFPERVEPVHKLSLEYPDGPQDAEGLAVHPNGDIYILSKEGVSVLGIGPAKLYRAAAPPWPLEGVPLPLEQIATLNLRELSGAPLDLFSHTATALDISPDGSRFMILTYGDAFELALDVSQLPSGIVTPIGSETTFKKIPLERLAQQEGLTYLEGSYSFIYTTEARGGNSPLIRFDCQN